MTSRKDYAALLRHNGVPEAKLKEACEAVDLWGYEFTDTSFHMDHRIPATNFRLNFVAPIDGVWNTDCPYQKTGTTASRWKEKGTEEGGAEYPGGWRNTWDPPEGAPSSARTRFRTELRNKYVTILRFWRELVSRTRCDCVIYIVRETEGADEMVVGPCWCFFEKVGDQLPCAPEEVEQALDKRHAEM